MSRPGRRALASLAVLSLGLGLAACRAKYDLRSGYLYACDRDAGLNADAGADPQCPGGYRCGLEGYCYPVHLDGGFPFPCEQDTDCNVHWRCGAPDKEGKRTCQDTRVAASYPCAGADVWCEGGWRCGPDDRCVDPGTDALTVPAPPASTSAMVSPVALNAVHLEAEPAAATFGVPDGGPVDYSLVALEGPDRIRAAVVSARVAAPASPMDFRPALLDTAVPLGAPFAVASGALYWALDGGMVSQAVQPGLPGRGPALGAPAAVGAPLGFTPGVLRQEPDHAGVSLLACAPDRAVLWSPQSGALQWSAPAPIRDCTWNTGYSPLSGAWVLAADGVYYLSSNGIEATAVRVRDAGFPEGARLAASGPRGVTLLSVLARVQDAGVLTLYPAPSDVGATPALCPVACRDPVAISAHRGPPRAITLITECASGPGGEPGPWLEARSPNDCSVLWAGAERIESRAPASAEIVLTGQTSLTVAYPSRTGFSPEPAAVTLTEAPLFVRGPGAELALTASTAANAGAQPWWRPQAGAPWLAAVPPSGLGTPLAAVQGMDPWWAVERAAANTDARTLDIVEGLAAQDLHLRLPRAGELASGPVIALAHPLDGGVRVVASAFDSVLEGTTDLTSPGTLQVRVTPMPRQPITSLALDTARPADGGVGPGLSGALVVQGRVFRFRAVNDVVWRADELPLGNLPAARDTWSDADGLRAGLVDGRVVALGSRVAVSSPLPGGAVARQFVRVAGQVLALADEGLYRLAAAPATDAGPRLAQWVRERGLDPALPEGADWTMVGARLQVEGRTLYAFTTNGSVGRLDFAP